MKDVNWANVPPDPFPIQVLLNGQKHPLETLSTFEYMFAITEQTINCILLSMVLALLEEHARTLEGH